MMLRICYLKDYKWAVKYDILCWANGEKSQKFRSMSKYAAFLLTLINKLTSKKTFLSKTQKATL